MHVGFGVPQHVDKLLIVLLVHGNILAQLWIKSVVGYANGAAPGTSTINDAAIRAGGLIHKQITWRRLNTLIIIYITYIFIQNLPIVDMP